MPKVLPISYEDIKPDIKEKLLEELDKRTYFNTEEITLKVDIKEIIASQLTENLTEPMIRITSSAFTKLRYLVNEHNHEVAWHGIVDRDTENSTYTITDILIYPQDTTGATVESIDGEYEQWLMEVPEEDFNNMRMQGHSHVNMSVGPSGTDEQYYIDLLSQVRDYYIVMITNKKGANHIRLYDKINNCYWTGLTLEVCSDDGQPIDSWLDIHSDKIKKKSTTYVASTQYKGTPKRTRPKSSDICVFSPLNNKLVTAKSADDMASYIIKRYKKQTLFKTRKEISNAFADDYGVVVVRASGHVIVITANMDTAWYFKHPETYDIWELC